MKPPAKAAPAPADPRSQGQWRPTLHWHLKVLAGIYAFLVVFYFAVSAALSRVPPPYRLRDIPRETTPWLKK